jgi:parallel beta-helix repeat protein
VVQRPVVAAKRIYYVATNGNDDDPGTETQPFRTLTHGVSVLTPRDTLYVMSGTYAEALLDNIPPGASWSAPITVAAAPGHTVALKPDSGAGWVLHFQGPQQYIVIDGLSLDASNVTYEAAKITEGGGQGAAHHIRIQNCEIKNSPGNGIFVKWAYANEFINLNVHHNGTTKLDHGLYIKSSGNLIQGSMVHNNAGNAIQLYNDLGGVDNNIVRDNQIYGNGGRGMVLSSGAGNSAYNNIIWGNRRGGITINYGTAPTNTAVYNNTLCANGQLGIYVGPESVGAVIRNNILYQNGGGIIDAGANTVSDHNLVDLDPR